MAYSTEGSPADAGSITLLLARWSRGERQAARELMPLVYDELRRIARRAFRRERRDHTLQTTALVHEAYLRLHEQNGVRWRDRDHFYGLAACVMRRVLVDHARQRAARKRGGHMKKLPLELAADRFERREDVLIALDDALGDLARLDPRKALIVELRFFGGLTVDQVASCLGLSPRSVAREWRRARAVLYHQLSPEVRDAL